MPRLRGSRQQRRVVDLNLVGKNVRVGVRRNGEVALADVLAGFDGVLAPIGQPDEIDCFRAWKLLLGGSWQRVSARPFEVARVPSWQAAT